MERDRKQAATKPGLGLLGWLPFALITVAVICAGVWFIWHQVAAQQAAQHARASNAALGIPEDYPCQLIPIYPGAKIVESKRETAKSDDGLPMDKWYIHATTTAERDKVHDYYIDIVTDLGLSQTMGIQIPTGYGFNYADQNLIVEFTVEVRAKDPLTQIEITLYKLQ
jgi:hypothetical protein